MAAETPPSPKKHRVIGWKPEGAETTVRPSPGMSRGTRNTLWILAAAFVIWRFGIAPFVIKHDAKPDSGGTVTNQNPDALATRFVDRSRAEFSRQAAVKAFDAATKLPTDNPVIRQRLVQLTLQQDAADKAFGDRDYAKAMQLFDNITAQCQEVVKSLEDMRKAREGNNKFLVDIESLKQFRNLAPDKFEAGITATGKSQDLLDRNDFTLALAQTEEAANRVGEIRQVIADELENSLSAGRSALTQGRGADATAAYNRALEFQPDNKVATNGLARAKTIDRVFAFNTEADRLEAAGSFEAAQKQYEQAFALDGQSAAAQAGISRLKAEIKTRDFSNALAAAKTAREASNWDAAITSYEAALKIEPKDKDVTTLLADAKVRQREAYIQASLASAYEFERVYAWADARKIYLDLLKYQPGQADAEDGLLRTGTVMRAILNFERRLDESRSQAQRADFQGAIAAFNEAMSNKPSYLELTPDQNQLKEMLERQSKPVNIVFVSDGATQVTVQGVRILGKFRTTTIPILPGNYEVVGRRKGFQEVREVLRVRGDDTIAPVTIIASKRQTS